MATTASWITSLTDSTLKADMTAASADGSITYAEMLKALTDLDTGLQTAKTTLSSSQFSDLKSIVTNLGSVASSYVADITNRLVNGDAANAKWTGGGATAVALGNLSAGSSATQLSELIGKWFLGTDHPASSFVQGGQRFTLTYQASSLPLFATGGPSVNDVNQGYIGDCYLLASLAEVANQNPALITSMIRDNGNGTYGVRFYVNGKADWVTVDNTLPTISGKVAFNDQYAPQTSDWVNLVEKAYAQLNAQGVYTGNGGAANGNSYNSIGNGGSGSLALAEITNSSSMTMLYGSGGAWSASTINGQGYSTSRATTDSNQTALSLIAQALNSHDDVILSSQTNSYDASGKQNLVSSHVMSIIGYNATDNTVTVRNPWGSLSSGYVYDYNPVFTVSLSTLAAAGDYIYIDNIAGMSPVLAQQTANQIWTANQKISFALPAGTFTDPSGGILTYSASLSNGQALPSWLSFDPTSRSFSGTAPATMQALAIKVTATDALGYATSETFVAGASASYAAPTLANATANLSVVAGQTIDLALAANTFRDPQSSPLTYTATLANGQALPSWLKFNAANGTLTGTAPTATGNTQVTVTATDAIGLSTSETFTIGVVQKGAVLNKQTAGMTVTGSTVSFALSSSVFGDTNKQALSCSAKQWVYSGDSDASSWLHFDPTTLKFSGSAPTSLTSTGGVVRLEVDAKDASGSVAVDCFDLTFRNNQTTLTPVPTSSVKSGLANIVSLVAK